MVISVDVGYGDTKVVGADGRRHGFPSRWAPHRATSWGIGAMAKTLTLDGGEPYVVGQAADGLPGCREPQADGRLADPATLPLLAAALVAARVPDGAEVALGSGLPLGRFDAEAPAAREALRGRTLTIAQGRDVRRVTIRRVVLRPQGVGAALCLVATGALRAKSGLVLVVDVGSRTTDVLALHARTLEPIPELSGSLALGVGDAAAALGQEIAAHAGFVPPAALAREALAAPLKGATAQGNVLGMLAATCGKTIALTGTLLGGYASDLFRIAFRLAPKALRAEELTYNSMEQWVDRYGVLERRITEDDGEWNSSSRGRKREAKPTERPGVSPLVFGRFLLPRTAFLELSDVAANLPPYEERVVLARMSRSDDPDEVTQESAYRELEKTLRGLVQETGQAGKSPFLGAFLHGTLAYPDKPFGNEPVLDPRDGSVVFVPAELPDDILYPKEEELVRLVRRELAAGRRCFVYTVYTDRRDVAGRLAEVLRREGVKGVEVLRASVAPERREAWLADVVKRGAKVVVGNPNLVKTGLDLLDFPTMVFYATGYSVYTLRQAARRSWRIGQKAPVRVYFLGYKETMQESALRFMGAKGVPRKRRRRAWPSSSASVWFRGLRSVDAPSPDLCTLWTG